MQRALRREHSVMYSRRHDIHPFESREELEALCKKTDASLFLFGSHSKKRPSNVVIGRTYEHKVLDMVELGISNLETMEEIVSSVEVPYHSQPFTVFQGDLWESDEDFKKLKSLINDFFLMNKRPKAMEIDKALTVAVCWSVTEDRKIFLNVFEVTVEGGSAVLEEEGKIIVEELGPNASFVMRRHSWAAEEEFKKATYIPKAKKKKINKNIKFDALGNKRGKLYMDRQNLKSMPTKRRRLATKGEKGDGADVIGPSKF
jgi:ribosome production factor 2